MAAAVSMSAISNPSLGNYILARLATSAKGRVFLIFLMRPAMAKLADAPGCMAILPNQERDASRCRVKSTCGFKSR